MTTTPFLNRETIARRCRAPASTQRGFTLMEAIVVISITAIVGAMVALFIRLPVQGFIDSTARADMADVADSSLRRMARDLRLSLPNSVRVAGANNSYLEMLQTKTGGRYLGADDSQFSSGNILNIGTPINCTTTPTACVFDVIGLMPVLRQAIVAGSDYVVVYNLGPGMAPGDAYDCSSTCNRSLIAGVSGNTITLTQTSGHSTVFAEQTQALSSPTRRFQIVTGPITYFCDGQSTGGTGNLYRFSGYPIQETSQPTAAGVAPLLVQYRTIMASGVDSCVFDYSSVANVHTGIITLRLNLLSPVNKERITLFQQVHVDNTP